MYCLNNPDKHLSKTHGITSRKYFPELFSYPVSVSNNDAFIAAVALEKWDRNGRDAVRMGKFIQGVVSSKKFLDDGSPPPV
jgi:hypothetical protein